VIKPFKPAAWIGLAFKTPWFWILLQFDGTGHTMRRFFLVVGAAVRTPPLRALMR